MDIKKPQLVKVEAFAYLFVGSSATPSYIKMHKYFLFPLQIHRAFYMFLHDPLRGKYCPVCDNG